MQAPRRFDRPKLVRKDHRIIKRRVNASQHFRSFCGAWRTIAGYEAIHMIRKGQACCSATGARSVYSIALLLVCLELKPNSYDYRTLPPSISSDNFGRR